jgi:uncharacterized cofD-like protein
MTLGPAVVAIGGGHGLAASLRAARRYAGEVTAVVSVADDGGSTGRLREVDDVPALGDIRRCLVALAAGDRLAIRAFEHRFERGDVAGHALGNLAILALLEETGDFVTAVREAGRLLGVVGSVLPAATVPVILEADTASGTVSGQVAIHRTASAIRRVWLTPDDPPAPPEAVEAIARADQVVIGPGSLYTSVLAAAAVPAIRDAVASAPGCRVYVCNLRPEATETAGYDVATHARALADHGISVDVVLADADALPAGDVLAAMVSVPLARPSGQAHDPDLLASALASLDRQARH